MENIFLNQHAKWRLISMDISRKIGILVFTAVPAIIGGGIVFAITHDYTAMWVYQVLLLFGVGAFVAR